VAYDEKGLEAIIFTADGDMRQSLNNLQVRLFRVSSLKVDAL
jgi:DNA polymerase III delta prime subunit